MRGVVRRWRGEVKEIHCVGMKRCRRQSQEEKKHKAMCQISTDENKRRHKSMKNKAKKAVSKAMREKAKEALTELQNCPYGKLMLVKGLKLIDLTKTG